MATLNFYLDKADKNGRSFIQMTYLANGQKFRHSVKVKITPNQWLASKQRLKVKQPNDEFVNSHLNSLEEVIRKAERESLLNHNAINYAYVKQKFDDALNKRDSHKTFLECFQEYIDCAHGKVRESTINNYKACLVHLNKFSKAKRYELSFERMNGNFYDAFVAYLRDDLKLLNNTAGTRIKVLKSFMKFATKKGYNKAGQEFKEFKAFREEGELIYLTEDELMTIYNMENLTDKQHIVRVNFCFACFTGLRFSDIAQIQNENIKEDYLEIRTEKTRDFLKIPLSPLAKEILKNNGGKLPRPFTNQVTNEYLKEIGEAAKINEQVQIIKYRGTEKVEFIEPKYKFLCTHTARRTFVTLSLEKGMRPETVMSITGHKDYKTFKKYIKLTDKVRLAEMNNVWSIKLKIA
jgi:site-specific recombinase XerD